MEKLKWHTETRTINELIPYPENPRQMTEKQKNDLEQSLLRFNLMSIPVINTDNTIISGHQRMKILQILGRGDEEIDVRVPNRKLNDEELREANLRENKNLGSWDWDELANFDIEVLLDVGFTREELIEDFGINDIENMIIDEDRIEIITVLPPEAPRLKERQIFYCNDIEEYEKVKEYFKTEKNGYLNREKLLELINND